MPATATRPPVAAAPPSPDATTLRVLKALEQRVLWLACWTIHNANHIRPNLDGLKVGGHQASSASMVSLMTALYFHVLRPEDRVAVKPHASPVFHAIQYLLGHQTRDRLENFRNFGGAQSYPSRTKDKDDVDFSTGSVGMGVAMTAFASLTQDYVHAHGWDRSATGNAPKGRMIALMGDAELDEGNIFEAMQEGHKHALRNTWWIVDYNRQSLDGVVSEGLSDRIRAVFRSLEWEVVELKYGALQQAAFAEPGGEALKQWIDGCPNALFSALTWQGGTAWRARLTADLAGNNAALDLIGRRSDAELHILMTNLGGHCLKSLLEAFHGIDHDRPTCFIAYTIKGYGTPLQGHKDNHAGLMNEAQMAGFRTAMGVPSGLEWEPFAGSDVAATELQRFLSAVPFNSRGTRRFRADRIPVPAALSYQNPERASTQEGFGRIMHDLAGSQEPLADRIITTSPDVTVSTNLGGWVNRRGLFGTVETTDVFREQKVPSTQKWAKSLTGQHLELGIAENNLFTALAAFGLSHSVFGQRIIPVGTVYDPFIARGLDALNYACYQDARFLLVATPSGITLAPEGGAHQSMNSPLIGMAQDGLASFEPAYVDELAEIMRWSFEYVQREGDEERENTWLRDEKGGSVYLRLTTRQLDQPQRTLTPEMVDGMIQGAYWLRAPGPNCEVVVIYQGCIAPEAIEAAGRIAQDRRDVAVLAVTSADRLCAAWHAARRARMRGDREARSHIDTLMAQVPRHAGLVTVIDAHPATLSWIGGVGGHAVHPLGVEHFGQSGTIAQLYAHHHIDVQSIVDAADCLTAGRPSRFRSW